MGRKFDLRRLGTLPRWSVIPIGLVLAAFAVVLGLVLEPAGYALGPPEPEPTPMLPAVEYGASISDACKDCHFSLAALEASAADPGRAEEYLVEPQSLRTPHGSLGCVACHAGEGDAASKEAAHEGIIADVTESRPEQCILCHRDLPELIDRDVLRIPHTLVTEGILHGETLALICSDCHGAVGHGFDPVSGEVACSMEVCVDCHASEENCEHCHETRAPGEDMTGCQVCHEGSHDVAARLGCSCCHISTKRWDEIDSSSHPIELVGEHARTPCFECHRYPNFGGLRYVCTDCHEPGHDWGGEDCTQCHDPGATWDIVASTWDKHRDFWEYYKGDHLLVSCSGCHFETYTELDPDCDSCHLLPESHDESQSECWLCH
jgi:hypothetical protein